MSDRKIGLRLNNNGETYVWFYSMYEVEGRLTHMCQYLKPGQSLEIKLGRNHRYIDYDENKDYDDVIVEALRDIKRYLERSV